MEQEKKQAVALMRYSAIAPLITGTQEDYESPSAYRGNWLDAWPQSSVSQVPLSVVFLNWSITEVSLK